MQQTRRNAACSAVIEWWTDPETAFAPGKVNSETIVVSGCRFLELTRYIAAPWSLATARPAWNLWERQSPHPAPSTTVRLQAARAEGWVEYGGGLGVGG